MTSKQQLPTMKQIEAWCEEEEHKLEIHMETKIVQCNTCSEEKQVSTKKIGYITLGYDSYKDDGSLSVSIYASDIERFQKLCAIFMDADGYEWRKS